MKSLSDKNLDKALRHFKANLDAVMTPPEIQFKTYLCEVIKNTDHKYESQAIFINKKTRKGYIVDFYLPTVKIAFEIDGAYHNTKEQQQYDKAKDEYLQSIGIDVVRISNNDAMLETVKKLIRDTITNTTSMNAITIFTSKRKKRPYWEGTEVISA